MSTTFGIKKKEEFIPVAFRSGAGRGKVNITWKNEIAEFLPDDTPVYPLDNTEQGVYTIGDLKELEDA